jgi:two-component system, NtrC family, sensor histidine kinase HydH
MKFTIDKKNYIYILIAFIVCILYLYYDTKENSSQITSIVESEAMTLANVILTGFENTISASSALEQEMIDNLEYNTKIISDKIDDGHINSKKLAKIAKVLDIELICILNKDNNIQYTSSKDFFELNNYINEEINVMKTNHYAWIEIGEVDSVLNDKSLYLFAKNNLKQTVIIGINADRLSNYRRNFGIGKQIFDVVNQSDIKYLLIQDNDGIISANGNFRTVKAINVDSILSYMIKHRLDIIGHYNYDSMVFEVIKPVKTSDTNTAIMRLGFSLDKYNKVKQLSNYRAIGIAITFFFTNLIIIVLLSTRKAYTGLEKEKNIISSYNTLILENMADAVMAVDSSDAIILVNNALETIFETNKSDILNRNYKEYLNISDKLTFNKAKEINIKINGKNKILSYVMSKIDIEVNSFVRIIIIRDLTLEKEIQSALQRKEKISAMGELAASVAHEIRNPLNSINIIAQRFELEFEPVSDNEEYFKLVKVVRDEAQRVNRIIKQFLDYARPAKLNLAMANIESIIQDCFSLMEMQMEQKNIIFEFDSKLNAETLLKIDNDKIKQVFINLFRNSIEAISSNGFIQCTIEPKDEYIEIIFSDSGGGIPEDIIGKIFNLYFTTKQSGTGLGLSVVHQIIAEHNGIMTVANNESGAEFIIKLRRTV